jgi:hypothetical protein
MEREKWFRKLQSAVSGLDVGGLAGRKTGLILENGNHRTKDTWQRQRSFIEEQ